MSMINSDPLMPEGGRLARIQMSEPASQLEDFVYIVSHDLRNSARALGEVPQWLRSDLDAEGVKLSADMREDLDLLERHARRLDRMLLDLLVYSRVGRLQEITKFALTPLLDRVVSESSIPSHVTLSYDRDLPDLTLGYKDAFVMVKSIIDNVVRHCRCPAVELVITAQRTQDGVLFKFIDDGPGVAAQDLQRIFRPMTTLRRRDEVEGSGMGLATLHRIASHYNGSVRAGPGPEGRGLCIEVVLRDEDLVATDRSEGFLFDQGDDS